MKLPDLFHPESLLLPPQDETWTDFDGPSWIQYDLFRKKTLPGSRNVNLVKFMLRALLPLTCLTSGLPGPEVHHRCSERSGFPDSGAAVADHAASVGRENNELLKRNVLGGKEVGMVLDALETHGACYFFATCVVRKYKKIVNS